MYSTVGLYIATEALILIVWYVIDFIKGIKGLLTLAHFIFLPLLPYNIEGPDSEL